MKGLFLEHSPLTRTHSPFNKDTCSLSEAMEFLRSAGYDVSKQDTFIYNNSENSPSKTKAYYVIESDTGLGYANVHARRDMNFEKLRAFNYWVEVKDGSHTHQFN